MRDEKNAASKKHGDISADDLLARLKLSYDDAPSRKAESLAGVNRQRGESLMIDDWVYRDAEERLHTSEAVTARDDSDLDVDELIDMYITKPRAEREAQKAELPPVDENGDDIVHEITRPEPEPAETLEDTHEYGESADEDDSIFAEPAAQDEVYADDDDVKIAVGDEMQTAEEAYEEISTEDEYESVAAIDTEKTAVFDISRVKQITEDDDDEISRAVDKAFAESATEVFTPVGEAELTAVDTTPTSEQVYGHPSDDEIDQTDLHIMIAFGMEDQLKKTVGEEEAIKLEDDIIQKHEQTSQIQTVAKRIEYTSRDQNNEIMSMYESKYKSLLIRIAAAAALLVCLFVIENFSLLGLAMPEFMRPTSYPVVYAMIDLQLVVFSGILVYRQVIEGYRSILERKYTPESLTTFVLTLSVIYSFAAGLTAPVEGFALYNLPVVLAVLLALVCEFMNLKREMYSFNVVASKKKKFVVTPVSDATESLEREIFNDYVPGEAQIIRVGKTDFVDGFFARSIGEKMSKPIIGILLPALLLLALVFAVLSVVGGGNAYDAFTAAFLTIALAAPLTLFVIYSYPFYKASKDAFENESAIIGETSLGEYSGSAVISFEDKEVFPSSGVKVTSIKVFGQNRIDEIIYNIASAFIMIGGPLADVFSQATHDMGHSEDVELAEVDDDGFTVTVDGELVYIGKASYMEKKDYDPPFDNETRKQEQNPSTGILYVAFNGQLAAKVYVQYTIDGEFEGILSQLYKTGMCVGIKSFDPNIDDLLLAKKIKAMKYPVKVIRAKNVEDIPHTFDRCESGVVSKRSVKALLKTVALCEHVTSVIRTNLIVGVLAMLIGAVVMVFVNAFGSEAALPSLYVLLYQLFWLIPVFVISKLLV